MATMARGFIHNGTRYYATDAGCSKRVDAPGRSTRYVNIMRDEYILAYAAHIRDLLGDDLDALEEAQDVRDDIAANAPPGY